MLTAFFSCHTSFYEVKEDILAEEYHRDLVSRVSRNEDPERICSEKADWIWSLGPSRATRPFCPCASSS
jgi:hypothetical protein